MAALIVTNSAPATPATVATPAALTDGLRDIKPPLSIPTGWEWVWWVAGALAVLALAMLLWLWWRHRQQRKPVAPVVPAHVRARQRLRQALAFIEQPKPFCIMVSDAARAYLEERFDFHAPERTTEEFLRELQTSNLLQDLQKESLARFLESCDLVKFARYEPGEAELRELYDSALRLVEETTPPDALSEVTPPAPPARPVAPPPIPK